MATMTVAQLKTLIAGIPAALDARAVVVPDGLTLPVVADEYTAPRGGTFYTTVALVNVAARTVTTLPYVRQDYSKLFLPDGSRDPSAFESDGRLKPDATDPARVRP